MAHLHLDKGPQYMLSFHFVEEVIDNSNNVSARGPIFRDSVNHEEFRFGIAGVV